MDPNLPELRDIHLPEGVSAFPPAYGWWVLLVSVVLAFMLYELIRFFLQKSKKRFALRLLDQAGPEYGVESARRMSELLRRVCVYKYPEASALYGKEWVVFLNRRSKTELDDKLAKFLLDAPYIAPATTVYSSEDVENLRKFCRSWIGENL